MKRYLSEETPSRQCVRGVLVGFDESGDALVDFPENPDHRPVAAISVVALTEKDLHREAVLLFEEGDPARPVLIGLRQKRDEIKTDTSPAAADLPLVLEYKGKKLIISAEQEVVLRCGKASIHLRKDGSVRIRGTEVVSRASATNRLRGGNVQIN